MRPGLAVPKFNPRPLTMECGSASLECESQCVKRLGLRVCLLEVPGIGCYYPRMQREERMWLLVSAMLILISLAMLGLEKLGPADRPQTIQELADFVENSRHNWILIGLFPFLYLVCCLMIFFGHCHAGCDESSPTLLPRLIDLKQKGLLLHRRHRQTRGPWTRMPVLRGTEIVSARHLSPGVLDRLVVVKRIWIGL